MQHERSMHNDKNTKNRTGKQDNQIYSINEDGRYSLNYTELIPDLINCIKYQQEEIDQLKKEIDILKGGK